MKKIAFFLSANDLVKKYTDPSLELVKLSVEAGYGFVYGGTNVGLMRQSAEVVESLHGNITAISSKEFSHKLRAGADECTIAEDLCERKRLFLQKSDAIVALPGGTGTLDELTDAIAHKKLHLFNKPVVLLNTRGFWDGLISQFDHMYQEGFIPMKSEELFFSSDDPNEILEYLRKNI
ncbi:MAG: TIGR00730 family Rossman fold protein [Candidatus Roizmanbacteria bacterium]|nr:TIGR00730 family Rossman fold protein [Candidatus Roizmanbacteria bacterium]